MTDKTDQPSSSQRKPTASSTLLPVSGTLLPPTEGGAILKIGTLSEDDLVGDVAAQLGKAGAEAREMASRAAALAAEKAPEIKKKAHDVTEKMGTLANRALKEAEASAQAAGAILADPEKRKAAIAANGRRVAIGVAAMVVLIGGGWAFAKHQATAIAKDRIDGFLIRYNLRTNLTYDDISASPFGSATLSGVAAKDFRGNTVVKIGSLDISDIEMKGDIPQGLNLSAKSVEVPFLALSKGEYPDPVTANLVGMGYTTLRGDVSLAGRINDKENTFSVETKGDVRDLGSWKVKLTLGGVSTAPLSASFGMGSPQTDQSDPLATLGTALTGLSALAQQITLVEAALTVDDSGYFKRNREIADADLPPDDAARPVPILSMPVDESALVRAGISPSEAKADREAMESWITKGGVIRIESNLDHPAPLFTNRNFLGGPSLAFDSPAAFFAAAKMKISN